WGSSAMLYAFVEGLCGIVDRAHSFRRVRCGPRWAATDEAEARVEVGYAASGARFGYRYAPDAEARAIRPVTEAGEADGGLHLLPPSGCIPVGVRWDGEAVPYDVTRVEESVYVDACRAVSGVSTTEVRYADA